MFLRRVPMRVNLSPKEERRRALGAKLQMRWTGPYRIIQVRSDVLYVCLVHGGERMCHAINMKIASASTKDYVPGHLVGRLNMSKLAHGTIERIAHRPVVMPNMVPVVAERQFPWHDTPVRDTVVLDALSAGPLASAKIIHTGFKKTGGSPAWVESVWLSTMSIQQACHAHPPT